MSTTQVKVEILGETYEFVCPAKDGPRLHQCAIKVAQEMKKVSERSIRGADRIAIMAALSISSELLQLQESVQQGEVFPAEEIERRIRKVNKEVYAGLEKHPAPSEAAVLVGSNEVFE